MFTFFSRLLYAIVPPEVFWEAKMHQLHFRLRLNPENPLKKLSIYIRLFDMYKSRQEQQKR